ncbi:MULTISPECIES: hypothetical protein [unclassified Micromonospora]|uniref:hypothetical protein n=1 Tax=unclassified Micromonospora TaxID=2617518 RepID=UPI000EF51AFA|nr:MULTISPECIES: hypothetical protein [unclassified Micromonospora]RLP94501.1 hypothetical protein EAD89_03920 [Micromonospora sp. BL4]RLP99652.1 hypothetical protein EAD98_01695 [Micromonospora sp. CV4]
MSDDTSNRPSRREQRPGDVTDPLLWQLAIDVLSAHEPDEDGACRNLLCAGQPWPCAARRSAEQSLRLARGSADTPSTSERDEGTTTPADRPAEGVPIARRAWSSLPEAAASAA